MKKLNTEIRIANLIPSPTCSAEIDIMKTKNRLGQMTVVFL